MLPVREVAVLVTVCRECRGLGCALAVSPGSLPLSLCQTSQAGVFHGYKSPRRRSLSGRRKDRQDQDSYDTWRGGQNERHDFVAHMQRSRGLSHAPGTEVESHQPSRGPTISKIKTKHACILPIGSHRYTCLRLLSFLRQMMYWQVS